MLVEHTNPMETCIRVTESTVVSQHIVFVEVWNEVAQVSALC